VEKRSKYFKSCIRCHILIIQTLPEIFTPAVHGRMQQRWRYDYLYFYFCSTWLILFLGTIFTPQTINSTAEIYALISSIRIPSADLNASITTLLNIYPDIPALGSPFNTGNNTFGLNSQYKRYAAICKYFQYEMYRCLTIQLQPETWVSIHWDELGCKQLAPLVSTHGDIYSQTVVPRLVILPSIRLHQGRLEVGLSNCYLQLFCSRTPLVAHTAEIPYVYGLPPSDSKAQCLSQQMMDYWISFATSLDPNDGLGSQRKLWSQHKLAKNSL
jgi:hypothetical protein